METKTRTEAIIEKAKTHLLQNYRTQPLVIERGSGCRVWDVEDRSYLDMVGGIATCSLGHCHPEVVAALKSQAERLWHVSNLFYNQPQIELAERLTRLSGLERAFFCNSGAEANEALIKLARKVQKDRGRPERCEIITFRNSFHGRTLATLAATAQEKYQKGFEPLPEGFTYAPAGDLEAVRRAVGPKTAAILLEPIQAEGGVWVAPDGFLRALRELCDQAGLLFLIDEIQTGLGRTGKMFAFQHEGIRPDAISLAKALGNGIPIAAMLCREENGRSLTAGTHGTTFGGNPLVTAVANTVVSHIQDPKMLESVREKGEHLMAGARRLQERLPEKITAVRGRGLLVGVEVAGETPTILARCREHGLLVSAVGERTVRFVPPFVVTLEELDEALRIFEKVLTA